MRSPVTHIGIGAQKAATSWLYKCLEEHPEICAAKGKETHFFSRHYDRGIDWYADRFSSCDTAQEVRIELSTTYLSDFEAPQRISKLVPNAQLFVSLRDPTERALSHMRHLHSKGAVGQNESLEDILSRHPDIIEHGLYGKHLERYLRFFAPEDIHFIVYEDIVSRPSLVVRELYRFLGVDMDFVPSIINERYNSSAQRGSRLFKKVNRLYLRLNRNRFGRTLIQLMRHAGMRTHHLTNVVGRKGEAEPFTLSAEEKAKLHRMFIDDICILEGILGRSFEHWKTVSS